MGQFEAGATIKPVAQVERKAMPQITAIVRNAFPRESVLE